MSTAARDRLHRLLAPVVSAAGYDLEDVQVQPAGRRRLVRVVVDRDGGVSLDEVAAVSHAVSATLDGADGGAALGDAPYVLEVTSPGVDRPLTEPRHWRRATTRLVAVTLADGGQVTGRVVGADEVAVTLDVAGDLRDYPYAEVARGAVQVEFNRPADDGEEQPWTST